MAVVGHAADDLPPWPLEGKRWESENGMDPKREWKARHDTIERFILGRQDKREQGEIDRQDGLDRRSKIRAKDQRPDTCDENNAYRRMSANGRER